VFNAANEVAVARFLRGDITFLQIEAVVERALSRHQRVADPDLGAILEADAWARESASQSV
jgi:1-deoxy-D-xylulose-5-phosphate reductoisomerase